MMSESGRAFRAVVVAASAALLALSLTAVAALGGRAAPAQAQPSGPAIPGYWLVASDGGVYALNTPNFGGMRGVHLTRPVVGGAPTSDGLGYWMVATDGGIFSFGDAHFYGSTGGIRLVQPMVGMAANAATGGYWMVASDGGVFSFNAPFFGSTGGIRLVQPVVGMAPTPDGKGYWLVASDGGVFSFGDAGFHGSTGGIRLARPIVGMAATPDGGGYWLVASDGGVFAFGDAGFYGSTGGIHLNKPVVAMSSTPDGHGYWLVASDGGVFAFGDAPFLGTSGSAPGSPPIVAMLTTATGYPFVPGSTGYDVSKYQCPPYGSLPAPGAFAVVEISGAINNYFNSCYQQEAGWAGPNMSSYIFMNPLPSPVPPEALTGPAGSCAASNVGCLSYNFGWYWARYWVNYSRGLGISPTMWWLDVELGGGWAQTPGAQVSNSSVISGAVAGLTSVGVRAGIYSTSYQWGLITGNGPAFPNIPLWVPGATTVSGGGMSATAVCTGTVADHLPFAGGVIVLVQYGYIGGAPQGVDPDYACL